MCDVRVWHDADRASGAAQNRAALIGKDETADAYTCPAGKTLTTSGTLVNDGATLLPVRGTALGTRSKPDAVRKYEHVEFRAASTNAPVTSPDPSQEPTPSSSRDMTANA